LKPGIETFRVLLVRSSKRVKELNVFQPCNVLIAMDQVSVYK